MITSLTSYVRRPAYQVQVAVLLVVMGANTASAQFVAIDTFEDRDLGSLNGQGNWDIADMFEVGEDPDVAGNQLMSLMDSGGTQDGYFELETPLENSTTGTLFFRFRSNDGLSHVNWGLSDVDAPTGEWFHFESQIRDARDNNLELDFRDGGGFTQLDVDLEPAEWYKIWMVIDNDVDETVGYVQSEVSFPEQTQLTAGGQDSFLFRNGTDDPLISFYIRAGSNHQGQWLLDDIYLDTTGENLNDPTSGVTALQAGDADQDLDFDQLDLVKVQVAAKYLSGQAATWGEGDWDGAPGGTPGNPPAGNGAFDQLDIISALAPGHYLTGPYGALAGPGVEGDEQTSLKYDANTGELSVDSPASKDLTSINITSDGSKFIGDKPAVLDGAFDNFAADNIFKATFGGSFGDISFGNVLPAGLSQADVTADLTAVGSLAGGGDLGNVDLIYVPEPSAIVLSGLGLLGISAIRRRRKVG